MCWGSWSPVHREVASAAMEGMAPPTMAPNSCGAGTWGRRRRRRYHAVSSAHSSEVTVASPEVDTPWHVLQGSIKASQVWASSFLPPRYFGNGARRPELEMLFTNAASQPYLERVHNA